MAINRLSRLKPGSLHPSLVDTSSGLSIISDSGLLSAKDLKDSITTLDSKLNDTPWKYIVDNEGIFEDIDLTIEHSSSVQLGHKLNQGNTYYSKNDKHFYVYIADITNIDSAWQPTNWIAANRIEGFLKIPLTLDIADKTYVNNQIATIIGVDATTLQSIQDLLDYIANNPTANIINKIADLETNKADKTTTYTKDILDAKFTNLESDINGFTDGFFISADYSCGSNPTDNNANINTLYDSTKSRITGDFTINYLIKQGVTVSETPLIIDQAPMFFTGLQPQNDHIFSRLNKVEINRDNTLDQGNSDTIQFTNIYFEYGFEIKDTTEYIKIIFNNCLFENTSLTGGDIFSSLLEDVTKQKIDLVFNDCTFNLTEDLLLKRVNANFNNCYFIDSSNNSKINFHNTSNIKIENSYLESCINLQDNSHLNAQSLFFKKAIGSTPYININNVDTNLSPSLAKLKDITFETYEAFANDYISGTGELYLDYNIIEQNLKSNLVDGTKIIIPRISSMINSGSGIELNKFFTPYGSENFFYNDEFARDAIAAMITSSTHSSGVSWTYADSDNELSLSLNSLSSKNLSDTNNIAYKNESNSFTETNTFTNINSTNITNNTRIITNELNVTSGTIVNLTTTTQSSDDNSTKAATTAFVTEKFSTLQAEFNSTEFYELSDVEITDPKVNTHFIKWDDTANKWINSKIDFDDLDDNSKVIVEGDSIFRLSQIDPPTDLNDNGDIPNTTRYKSTNQVLAWNGQDRTDNGVINYNAKYIPVRINEIILYATEALLVPIGETNAGAGIITIASSDATRDGSNKTEAVVPEYLLDHYLRTDASNIDVSETQDARNNLDIDSEFIKIDLSNAPESSNYRTKIGLPEPDSGKYLKSTTTGWQHVDRSLSYFESHGLDYDSGVASGIYNAEPSRFYSVKTPGNQSKILKLPDINALSPVGATIIVRKENGSTHAAGGTISIQANDLDDVIVTADNEVITSSGVHNAQIDLVVEGHTVELYVSYNISLDKRVWYAFGYYYNSANQTQPTTVIELTQEATEDAIVSLFDHTDHSSALSINYDDPNKQLELSLAFASQNEVDTGTESDKPIAPNTLKSVTDTINTSIATNATFASNTYLAKASNLTDLASASTARTNLGLGTASVEDIGINSGELLVNGTLTANNFTKFDGTNLITSALPTASTTVNGIVSLATTTDTVVALNNLDNTKALTGKALNDTLTESNVSPNPLRDTVLSLTNTLQYVSSNTNSINAVVANHYSLRTNSGAITITLPDVTTVPLGSYIIVKFKQKTGADNVTITPHTGQTIDLDSSSFVLDIQGSSATLVAANFNNEVDWEII